MKEVGPPAAGDGRSVYDGITGVRRPRQSRPASSKGWTASAWWCPWSTSGPCTAWPWSRSCRSQERCGPRRHRAGRYCSLLEPAYSTSPSTGRSQWMPSLGGGQAGHGRGALHRQSRCPRRHQGAFRGQPVGCGRCVPQLEDAVRVIEHHRGQHDVVAPPKGRSDTDDDRVVGHLDGGIDALLGPGSCSRSGSRRGTTAFCEPISINAMAGLLSIRSGPTRTVPSLQGRGRGLGQIRPPCGLSALRGNGATTRVCPSMAACSPGLIAGERQHVLGKARQQL